MNNKKLVTVSMAFIMASSNLAMAQSTNEPPKRMHEITSDFQIDPFNISLLGALVSSAVLVGSWKMESRESEKYFKVVNQVYTIDDLKNAVARLEANTELKNLRIQEIIENPSYGKLDEVENLVRAINSYSNAHDQTFTAYRTFSQADLAKNKSNAWEISRRISRFQQLARLGFYGTLGFGLSAMFSNSITEWIHADAQSGSELMNQFSELTLSEASGVLNGVEIVLAAFLDKTKQDSLVK